MKKIMVMNGPNLNLLGSREPGIYGSTAFADLQKEIAKRAEELEAKCDFYQSNCEGELVTAIQKATDYDGIILNAGAYTHTSIAIRDAISAIGANVVEVHISNVYAREAFRHISMIAPVCKGVISGFGTQGYIFALEALVK